MFALTCLLVAMATVCNAQLLTLTAADKQAILDAHNRLRAQTAMGLTGSQPTAANMLALEWDDRLMNSANTWVQKCQIGHDSYEARAMPGYTYVGQNFAAGSSTNSSSFVQSWFDEYQYYTYNGQGCSDVCGHYTQVVWAKTALVGCGLAKCDDIYGRHFVCNYATAGNFNGEQPYVSGPAGSQCTGDYTIKRRGLCLRKDQCTESDCACTLTSCTNGATLDSSNCKCNCLAGFYGDRCEKKCEDEAASLSLCKSYGENICKYTGYDLKCAVTCKMCRPNPARDPLVLNADGVKARSP